MNEQLKICILSSCVSVCTKTWCSNCTCVLIEGKDIANFFGFHTSFTCKVCGGVLAFGVEMCGKDIGFEEVLCSRDEVGICLGTHKDVWPT